MNDLTVQCDAAQTNNNTEYRIRLFRLDEDEHWLDADGPDEEFYISIKSTGDGSVITTNTGEENTTTLKALPADEREEVFRKVEQIVRINIKRTHEHYPEDALETED